ncbi:MAG: hypothetical protein JWL81_1022, partial [Verrucomicrobiales bacterium]|nr:hypothetical protein [Verrucomicrobiales bacterium]
MSPAARFLLWPLLPAGVLSWLAIGAVQALIHATARQSPILTEIPPPAPPAAFLQQWCTDCHGGRSPKGDLSLENPDRLSASDWENVRRHVLLHTMPPDDEPAPPTPDRASFAENLLTWQASLPGASPAPSFRRLSRREAAHSLTDLLGVPVDPSQLPEEESAHGFDNNADFQPLPPAVLERYATVIRDSVRAALLPPPVPRVVLRLMPQEFQGAGGPSPDDPSIHEVESGGAVRIPISPAHAGRYRVTLTGYAHQAGDAPVQLILQNSPPLPVRSLRRTRPDSLSTEVDLPAGPGFLSYQLANPFSNLRDPDPHHRIRRFLALECQLEGPLDSTAETSGNFVRILGPVPGPATGLDAQLRRAADSLARFAARAWRRPVSDAESTRLAALAGDALAMGMRYDQALALAAEAILTSPRFLFLPDPAATSPAGRPHAIAARLSYLLWSTHPDDRLTARGGRAWTPGDLQSEARRMLDDPRAAAFARDFAGQWLQLRNVSLSHPDTTLFPDATPELLESMQRSSELFFLHLLRENRPVSDLLKSDTAFLDQRLASFLSLPAPASAAPGNFALLTLPASRPTGILGQPAILLLTSYPNRTSPVLRGKFVLETLLGLQPPPPPPNVPTLQAAPDAHRAGASVRAALEAHRADPACASCHRAIDPLGFPLEEFDAIGRPLRAPGTDTS